MGTYIPLILAALFWGLSFIGTKIALESFTVYSLILVRFGAASLIFAAYLAYRGFPSLSARDHGKLLATAVFQPVLYFMFETTGLQYTSASEAAIITATIPLIVPLFSFFFIGEKIRGSSIAGIIFSFIGIVLLISGDTGFSAVSGTNFRGNMLMLGAVLSATAYMMIVRELGKRFPAIEITGIQMIYGTLLLIPVCLRHSESLQFGPVSLRSAGAVLFLVFFATIAAFFFYNHALTRISASRAAIFVNGVPVVAVIGGWFVLGERLSIIQAAGGLMVLASVYWVNYFEEKQQEISDRICVSPVSRLLRIFRI